MKRSSAASSSGGVKVERTSLDLAAYAAQYRGNAALQRTLFAAERCDALRPSAAALLAPLRAQQCPRNVALFRAAWDLLHAPGDAAAWAEQTARANARDADRAEAEIAALRAGPAPQKDALLRAHVALGDLQRDSGDGAAAVRLYLRARDFATAPEHHAAVHVAAARAALEIGGSATVSACVAKLESLCAPPTMAPPPGEQQQQPPTPPAVVQGAAMGRLIGALQLLQSRSYRNAARKLHDVDPALLVTTAGAELLATVASPRDVALYGALCSLATLDRGELKRHVLDNASFREWLDAAPDVRELVEQFYAAQYGPCLAALERMRSELLLDLYLSAHAAELLQRIRERAITQYFGPYASVDMRKMAAALGMPLPDLERDLARLIAAGHIAARIDSQNKVLLARHDDQRSATFDQALAAGEDFAADARGLILRVDLLRNNFGTEPFPAAAAGAGKTHQQSQPSSSSASNASQQQPIAAAQIHQAFASAAAAAAAATAPSTTH